MTRPAPAPPFPADSALPPSCSATSPTSPVTSRLRQVRKNLKREFSAMSRMQGGFADLKIGEIRVAGVGPFNTRENVATDFKTIAPRMGIAYQWNPKTVIRAGYGRDYDLGVFGSIFGHVVTQNLPVLASQNLTSNGLNSAAFNLATGPAPFTFPAVPSNGLIPFPTNDTV